MEVIAYTIAVAAVRRKRHTANAAKIRGELRNVRVSRPLYKDPKRKGTRLDFDVTIWNEGHEADHLDYVQTLSVCTKDQSGRTHIFIQE